MRKHRGGDPRRTKLMRDSGPYAVIPLANGEMKVKPAWAQFPQWNEETGGGPGMMSRMKLAEDIQRLLNRENGA